MHWLRLKPTSQNLFSHSPPQHTYAVSSPQGNTKQMGPHLKAPSVSSWIYQRFLTFVELNVRKLRLCDKQMDQKCKWVAKNTI